MLNSCAGWRRTRKKRFLEGLKSRATAVGVPLRPAQLRAFSVYAEALETANERFNLTAIPASRFLEEHFIDSLALVQTRELLAGGRCCDIGAGAGFPGLPIKIAIPGIELLLVESNKKKAEFLREVSNTLALSGVTVYGGRAESAGQDAKLRGAHDVVVARAVASMAVLIEYAMPLLRVGGSLLALKGPQSEREMDSSRRVASKLGAQVEAVIAPQGLQEDRQRSIVVVRKNEPTDPRFPRRVGIPGKRPLGG